MSLDNCQVVDAVGAEKDGHTVVLTILDSWDWSDERIHLRALQDKLNAYFAFVESGQLYSSYPDATGKNVRIDIICRYPITPNGLDFLAKASAAAAHLQIAVAHKLHEDKL